ncbi:hypothetical protein K7X08_035978 [Anisodus acutangulus]|uniref:Uncharacterized protein n=1 Tax=Anisodus acutangulus TaxID=402998 RepID=A0A9Q1L804_9SOLA|nr:hypothetical protein K7X08_035978 [Anisodus acutangulus]
MDLPRMTLHPGPEEYDVLIIQEKHRSHGVWNGTLTGHNAYLSSRRADREFSKHMRRHPLHPRILDYFGRFNNFEENPVLTQFTQIISNNDVVNDRLDESDSDSPLDHDTNDEQ